MSRENIRIYTQFLANMHEISVMLEVIYPLVAIYALNATKSRGLHEKCAEHSILFMQTLLISTIMRAVMCRANIPRAKFHQMVIGYCQMRLVALTVGAVMLVESCRNGPLNFVAMIIIWGDLPIRWIVAAQHAYRAALIPVEF